MGILVSAFCFLLVFWAFVFIAFRFFRDDATKPTEGDWRYSEPKKNVGAISPAVEKLGRSLNQKLKQLLVVHRFWCFVCMIAFSSFFFHQ